MSKNFELMRDTLTRPDMAAVGQQRLRLPPGKGMSKSKPNAKEFRRTWEGDNPCKNNHSRGFLLGRMKNVLRKLGRLFSSDDSENDPEALYTLM
jgi:hypothetical protein